MDRTQVVSSAVNSIGYDAQNKILEIEYQEGNVYDYYEVSQEVYDALINAPSIGHFVDDFIKNVYAYD